MVEAGNNLIFKYFHDINEPRSSNKRHKLIDMITIGICAVICGADGYEAIEEFGNARYEWFETFLELPHGIPSHDTIGRVFSRLNPEEFERAFLKWIYEVRKISCGQIIAIDGKTLRRSYDKNSAKAAIHMVSAWASENRLILGQIKTEEKSNEITAIPELLSLLEIQGCIVTIDAMGTQKEIASRIINKGGDYVPALRGNQKNLYEDVKLFFEDARQRDFKDIPVSYYEETDGGHGRVEVRRYRTVEDIEWLYGKENWKGLNIIGMAESERHIGNKISIETRYYISSIENNAEKSGRAIRSHWGIENSVHWTLDITFREDESRIRKGYGPENIAVMRHIALNMLRNETSSEKKSIRLRRLRAGWDNAYLKKVLYSV